MNKKRNVNYFSCENSVMVRKSIYHASFQSVKTESLKIERGKVDKHHQYFFW